MIFGVGNDLIDIRRIEKTLERYGERFLTRVFTEIERKKSERAPTVPLPTPSGSPPRRPAPRRWAPGCAMASIGATWVS